jgi:molybdopterin converting factor small subunit
MATLRLFGPAREAAGGPSFTLVAGDVASMLTAAESEFGPAFSRVLDNSRVWLNGEEVVDRSAPVAEGDEVAVLPPVSGG